MKLALPLTATDEFSPHFGAATKFAVFDVDPTYREVRRRGLCAAPTEESSQWPRHLRAAGVELVLVDDLTQGERWHLAEHGVRVMAGVTPADPEEIVIAWLEGRLVAAEPSPDDSMLASSGGTGPRLAQGNGGWAP